MDRVGSYSEESNDKRTRERSRSRHRTREGSDSEDSNEKRPRERSRSRHRTPEDGSKESRHEEKKEPSLNAKKRWFKDDKKGRQYECALCTCVFYTVSQYNLHIQSFEHRKRVIARRSAAAPYIVPGKGKVRTHCAICNVFLNSNKQRSEHLNGSRHKQLCFKLNVPLTSLKISKDHTETLEDTRLHGRKLMCKYCSVELNSMQQYEDHMKSKNHLLRKEHKSVNHSKSVRKATKALSIKNKKKEKEEREENQTPKKDKSYDEKEGEPSVDDSAKDKDAQHELPIKVKRQKKEDDGQASKVLQKYGFGELLDLNYGGRPLFQKVVCAAPKAKKPPKPVPYMCDICQVFVNSAFHLNEHLLTEGHREKLSQLISGQKKTSKSAEDDDDCSGEKSKKPELYCDICQCMSASKSLYDSHLQGKKHKFLAELKQKSDRPQKPSKTQKSDKKNTGTDPRKVELYCEICQETQASQKDFDEHIKSKKHKFLSELKPPHQKPQAQPPKGQSATQGTERPSCNSRVTSDDTKAKWQPSGRKSSDRKKRHRSGSDDRAERHDKLSTYERLVLERKMIQKELEKREKEIEKQKKLVVKLQTEKEEEKEKAVLRKMIAECRQLIEERQRKMAEMNANEESWKRDTSPSSRSSDMWNRSPPGNEYEYGGNELQSRTREFKVSDFCENQGGQQMFVSEQRSKSDTQRDRFQPRFTHDDPGSHEPLHNEPVRFGQQNMSPDGLDRRHQIWQNDEVRRSSGSTFPHSRHSTDGPLNWNESATQGQQLHSHLIEQQSGCTESWHAMNRLDKQTPAKKLQSREGPTDLQQGTATRETEGEFTHSPARWSNLLEVSVQEEPWKKHRSSQQEVQEHRSLSQAAHKKRLPREKNIPSINVQQSGESSKMWPSKVGDSQQLSGTSFQPWCVSQESQQLPDWPINQEVDTCKSSAPVLSQHGRGNLQQLYVNPEQKGPVWQKNEDHWPPAASVTATVPSQEPPFLSQQGRQIQPSQTWFENIEQWKPRSNLVHIQTVDIKPSQHREYSALKQVPIVDNASTGTVDHIGESCYQKQTCKEQIPIISQHGSNSSEGAGYWEIYDNKDMDDNLPSNQSPAQKRKTLLPLPRPNHVMQNSRDSSKLPFLDSSVGGARDKDEKECHFISNMTVKSKYTAAERHQPWNDRSVQEEDTFSGKQCPPQQKESTLPLLTARESYNAKDPWNSGNLPFLDSKTESARGKPEDKYKAKPPADTSHAATSSEARPTWSRDTGHPAYQSPRRDPGTHPAQQTGHCGGSIQSSYRDWPLAGGTESTLTDSRWGRGSRGDTSRFDPVREPEDRPSWTVSESNRPAYSHGDRKEWTEISSGSLFGISSNKEKGFDTKWANSGRQSAGREQSPDSAKMSTSLLEGGSNEGTVRIPGFDYV